MNEIPPSSLLEDISKRLQATDRTRGKLSSDEFAVVGQLLYLVSKETQYEYLIIETQRESLLYAIEMIEDILAEADIQTSVRKTVESVRHTVRTARGTVTEIEGVLATAASEVLTELNNLGLELRSDAVRPMYDHLQRRADMYLDVIGYSSVSEQTWEIT